MIFGTIRAAEAEGAILAHALKLPGRALPKGSRIDAGLVHELEAAGVAEIVAARLETGDVPEDAAARRAAAALMGPGLRAAAAFTGRVNLLAEHAGLLVLDTPAIDRLNRIDESLTVATLAAHTRVRAGQMVATIKVIPFAATEAAVAAWEHMSIAMRIAAFRPRAVALIQTELPETKPAILDKTSAVTAARLESVGSTLVAEGRCPHRAAEIAVELERMLGAGAEMVLICGASAIVDRRDEIPLGIEAAGGSIEHFGMPVDPGNLLLLARHQDRSVLGLPGCARSPKLNGFDWVLERLLAGLPVGPETLKSMGVGGLLTEIPTRPQPRQPVPNRVPAGSPDAPQIAAVVLAAGRSSRMGRNKLAIEIEGKPLLRLVVETVLASRARPVVVVCGHDPDAVRGALRDLKIEVIENEDYASGLASSLQCGLGALPDGIDGALICLGDMPGVDAALIDRLIQAFDPAGDGGIVVPRYKGRRGNPVLWAADYFPQLMELSGDRGARDLIAEYDDRIAYVEAPDDGTLVDLDTPEALAAWQNRHLPRQS